MELKKILEQKGVDSCIAHYKKMKAVYDEGCITEGILNKLGYDRMGQKDFRGAIKLFSLNVAMYPNSFNTYDSFAEAFLSSGDTKEAIRNYEKSLALNPANRNAANMLNKLKASK